MTKVSQTYETALNAIIGMNRVTVRMIHNDEDICINSHEREILQTIQNIQRKSFGVEWQFKENLYGKSLILPLDHLVSPTFDGFTEEYKLLFQQRIQMIIDRYDSKTLEKEKYEFYAQVKTLYFTLIANEVVNFDEYLKVRNLFERVRY